MQKKQSTNDWFTDLDKFIIPSYEEWEQIAISSLKGKPIEKLHTNTYEGITLKPVYTSLDSIEKSPQSTKQHLDDNSWDVCQEINASTLEEAIASVKDASNLGQTSINLQLASENDLQGINIKDMDEFSKLLDTIPFEKVKLFINTRLQQSSILTALSIYQKGIPTAITGVVGGDPIAEWVVKGRLPRELPSYYDEMTNVLKEFSKTFPGIKTILVQSHPFHNGGANAAEELAFTMSVAIEYVRQCLARNLTIDEIAPHFAFSFSVGSNLFMEVAKLRAANYLWASILNEFGGSKKLQKIWIHGKTSSATKTKLDPYVNMLRSTMESFAAVIGGANSIHTSTFDEAFQTTTPFSERNARNIQSILSQEAHLNRVIDPSSGSWYIESLTKELAEKAWNKIQSVERMGGITEALRINFIQDEIKKSRDSRFEKIDFRKERIVGTNMYANIYEENLKTSYSRDSEPKDLTRSKVFNLKLSLLQEDYFARLKDELSKGTNFIELEQALNGNKTQEQSIEPIPAIRWSMKIEQLRENASSYFNKTGKKPSVHIINLGEIIKHKPRTDFIQGFFEVGGYHVTQSNSFLAIDEMEKDLESRNEEVFVICGPDEKYAEIGKNVIELVKRVHPSCQLFIAGNLANQTDHEFINVGLNDCIHMNTNCYQFLIKLQSRMSGGIL